MKKMANNDILPVEVTGGDGASKLKCFEGLASNTADRPVLAT